MKIFSLSRLIDLSRQLPAPTGRVAAPFSSAEVLRLSIGRWDPVRDAEHPEWELERIDEPFAEFQLTPLKDVRGAVSLRWVLRGVVAF